MIHTLSQILVAIVAVIHLYVFILETFLWTRPYGLKVFNQRPEVAENSKVLAANQGVYNSFLAMGLIVSLFFHSQEIAFAFQLYFLSCVFLAGVYGALTTGPKVGPRIFVIQSAPALLGLLFLFLR